MSTPSPSEPAPAQPADTPLRIALDVMGSDAGVETVIEGLARAQTRGLRAKVILHGREDELTANLGTAFTGAAPQIVHADDVIAMTDKPAGALRRGRKSSMWSTIAALKAGDADVAVSSGNTGALMAMSVFQLRVIEGIDRPAIAALWPTSKGDAVVLDVGANVETSAKQLVQFAIMGEAYCRAITGKAKPTVGLLNVGAEELKGHSLIRDAANTLREADPDMAFQGFVEGSDISKGTTDVVVTDGFTGNIALKTAEGTASMIGGWIKGALTGSLRAKLGAAIMLPALKMLKHQMNPSRVNGGAFVGVNGLVVKSHGGADADGVASALLLAERLAKHPLQAEIARTVRDVEARVVPQTDDDAANGQDTDDKAGSDTPPSAAIAE